MNTDALVIANQTFRKSLQELDAEYLKKAFNAMSEESKVRVFLS